MQHYCYYTRVPTLIERKEIRVSFKKIQESFTQILSETTTFLISVHWRENADYQS